MSRPCLSVLTGLLAFQVLSAMGVAQAEDQPVASAAPIASPTVSQPPVTERLIVSEFDASSRSSLRYKAGASSEFWVIAGYHRTLVESLQASARIFLDFAETMTIFDLVLGPTLNFPVFGAAHEGPENSFFLSFGAGIRCEKAPKATQYGFSYSVETGKRFTVTKSINYKPEFRITGNTISTNGPDVDFIPLQFSFFWE